MSIMNEEAMSAIFEHFPVFCPQTKCTCGNEQKIEIKNSQ